MLCERVGQCWLSLSHTLRLFPIMYPASTENVGLIVCKSVLRALPAPQTPNPHSTMESPGLSQAVVWLLLPELMAFWF